LITLPFTTLSPTSAPYLQAFLDLITFVLTIPLLPNRIPLRSLTALSSGLPIASFSVVAEKIPTLVDDLSMEASIHLVANLLVFVPPRYTKLSEASMDAYLLLMVHLLNKLPANILSDRHADKSKMTRWSTQDSDSEDEPEVTLVNNFTPSLPQVAIPELDQRTVKRLSVLPTPTHLLSILPHRNRMRLAELLFALTTSWPAEKELVLGTFAVYGGGELVSEIYRDIVRGSYIGKDLVPGQFLGMSGPLFL
jgi:ubiquitin-protein ligase E3 C